MAKTVIFCFAGRRANMELQLPFIRRILAEHPDTEYHVWDLARTDSDHHYLHTIKGERITVRGDFYGYQGYDKPFRYYNQPKYQDCLFIKIDDDIVFLETARFGQFVAAIDAHRGSILTANIVNNGACTAIEPGLWQRFESLAEPLLRVHKNNHYAVMAHSYFFNHPEMLGQPVELIPTEDWLSINLIGYDWPTTRYFANLLGTRPRTRAIAGRGTSRLYSPLGDEGIANMLPRIIVKGFLAGHLSFGPQDVTEEQLAGWRERYAEIGRHYLAAAVKCDDELPDLSPAVHRYNDARADHAAATAARWSANNWRVRWT